jgi:hypothetical protein
MSLRDDHQPITFIRTPITVTVDLREFTKACSSGRHELDEFDAEAIRKNPFVQLQMTVRLRLFISFPPFRGP